MTINHVVILTFEHPVGSDDQRAIIEAFNDVMSKVPSVRGFHTGFDIGLTSEPAKSCSIFVKFDSKEGYLEYANHPEHVKFVNTFIKPRLAIDGRRAIQYEDS